jgi:histidinol-phosphate aminotransferase
MNNKQYLSTMAQTIQPYQWTFGGPAMLRFNSNTLSSPPKSLTLFLNDMLLNCPINEYADPDYTKLTSLVAEYEQVDTQMITITNSGDEAIDIIGKTFLNPGDTFITLPPTYEMFSIQCKINRGLEVEVPLLPETFQVDYKKVITIAKRTSAKIIFVCNPNNPTGSVTPQIEIENILKATASIVVVDETYREFYGQTAVPLLKKYKNLIILRSLSKFGGMAGARVGYLLANPAFSQTFNGIRFPMGVSYFSSTFAEYLLAYDQPWIKAQIVEIKRERNRLENFFKQFGWKVYPSESNFLLVNVGSGANELTVKLRDKGILIRDRSNKKYLDGCVRITIRSKKENDTLMEVIRQVTPQKIACDSIIFDMDGVLVDVSRSYRQAIKLTVAYVLKKNYNLSVVVTDSDIQMIKDVPGFNNDWDVSFALIRLSVQKKKIGNKRQRTRPVSFAATEYQFVKDIFQSYYLGESLFLQCYNRRPPVLRRKGLILNEVPLIKPELLTVLSTKFKIGIATSRPRFEALFALKNLHIIPKIINEDYIIAQEDAIREKPDPAPLLEAKRKMHVENPIYVGDTVNDVIAAKKANMPSVFVGTDMKDTLNIQTINELEKIVL